MKYYDGRARVRNVGRGEDRGREWDRRTSLDIARHCSTLLLGKTPILFGYRVPCTFLRHKKYQTLLSRKEFYLILFPFFFGFFFFFLASRVSENSKASSLGALSRHYHRAHIFIFIFPCPSSCYFGSSLRRQETAT